MFVTQKTRYALRAIFELARHRGKGPIKISEIAEAQSIPVRFLEVILGQLKRSGIVASKRGYYGGYSLVSDPADITVGDIFRFTQQKSELQACIGCVSSGNCPLEGQCVFYQLWLDASAAVFAVFDKTTVEDLLAKDDGLRDADEKLEAMSNLFSASQKNGI